MWLSSLRSAALIGFLVGTAGCGGGGSGPRGGVVEGPEPTAETRIPLRTVMYLPSYQGGLARWSSQLAFHNVSYVNLSFASVTADGTVSYGDAALSSFISAAHDAGTKVCLALGGASTIEDGDVFATLLADDQRGAFVDKLMTFTKSNQFDCIDVDLEGNGVNQYYEAFVTDLAARLKPDGLELTAAVAAWFGDRITDKALQTFDFVNVMAYDLYQTRQTPMQWSSIEASQREVDRWVARGLPPEKVVWGVPFYGLEWPVGGGDPMMYGYGDLLRRDPAAETQDELSGAGTITYLNSRATIQTKTQLSKGYGGIMAWELGQDATGDASLLQAIREAVEP